MAKKTKDKKEASSNKDDAFSVNKQEKKDLGTLSPNNTTEPYTEPKNVLYVYKDKSTTRVTYDSTSDIYKTVIIGA